MMTFFEVFDVPVFWPILLFYWVMLFILTMRKQIQHMIKYRYVPFSFGKQVCVFFFCFTFAYLTSWVMVFVTFCPWLLLLAEIWKETGSSREQWMIKSTVQVFSFLLIARSFVSDWVRRNDQSDTLVACLRQVFFVVALLSSSWLWTGFTWKQCILLIQFFVSENNVFFVLGPFVTIIGGNMDKAFWCILVLNERDFRASALMNLLTGFIRFFY